VLEIERRGLSRDRSEHFDALDVSSNTKETITEPLSKRWIFALLAVSKW